MDGWVKFNCGPTILSDFHSICSTRTRTVPTRTFLPPALPLPLSGRSTCSGVTSTTSKPPSSRRSPRKRSGLSLTTISYNAGRTRATVTRRGRRSGCSRAWCGWRRVRKHWFQKASPTELPSCNDAASRTNSESKAAERRPRIGLSSRHPRNRPIAPVSDADPAGWSQCNKMAEHFYSAVRRWKYETL